MLREGLVGITLLCPHQFQCAFIPEFNHWRGARPHRGDAFSCVNTGVQSLRWPVPKPALCRLSLLVLSVWDCALVSLCSLSLPQLCLSQTLPSVCSSSLGTALSHFHFLMEDRPLTHQKSYDGSLPGAEKMHRETEKAHLIEIIVPDIQPLKGRQRELQVKSTKWKWFILCKAQGPHSQSYIHSISCINS